MRRLTFRYCILVFLFVASAFAGGGGSGYSRYGIGDLRYVFSEQTAGMGSAGIALRTSNSIDRFNPAGWSNIYRTRFSLGAQYEGYNTTDGNTSSFLSGTSFGGFMIAVPVYTTSGIVIGTGITPYSTVNYDIVSSGSFQNILYDVNYKGEGGLSEAQIGFSLNPHKDFSTGIKMSYYFGTLRHNVTQTFSVSDYSNVEEIRSLQAKGLGVTFGVVYSGLNTMLHLDTTRSLTLGMVASTSSRLSAIEEHFFAYTATNQQVITRDTIALPESNLTLPVRLGFGAAFSTPEFAVVTDLLYQQWSDFSGSGVITGSFRDNYRFSVGGELFPKREATATFFQRWAYRLGLFHNASYYKVKGESINETGFTAGFGIPIISDTRLNIAAEYSFRGTTSQQLQKDKILRLSFILSGSERWFIPIEEE